MMGENAKPLESLFFRGNTLLLRSRESSKQTDDDIETLIEHDEDSPRLGRGSSKSRTIPGIKSSTLVQQLTENRRKLHKIQ